MKEHAQMIQVLGQQRRIHKRADESLRRAVAHEAVRVAIQHRSPRKRWLIFEASCSSSSTGTSTRQALLAFTVADALWVAASALVLLLFWAELAGVARFLVIAVALVVEVFATLQFLAAGRASSGAPQVA